MDSSWLSSRLTSVLQFTRRNAGKIVLISVAAGSAIATVRYVRRQFADIDDSRDAERIEGARRLRMVFVANTQKVGSVFRNLLPRLGDAVTTCEIIDVTELIARLKDKPKDRVEKQGIWENIKIAALTHLSASVYLIAVLYTTVSLQMNLLARYTSASDIFDAPVQTLPSGALVSDISKQYLNLLKTNLLSPKRVAEIVGCLEIIVKKKCSSLGLGATLTVEELKSLLTDILQEVLTGSKRSELVMLGAEQPFEPANCLGEGIFSSIFRETAQPVHDAQQADQNYDFLVRESLDLCEVLDMSDVTESISDVVLNHVSRLLRAEIATQHGGMTPPVAKLLSSLSSVAAGLLCEESDATVERWHSTTRDDRDALENALRIDEAGIQFAASVFLSGEKDGGQSQPQPMQIPDSARDAGPVSQEPIRELRDEGSDDLGLMFELANSNTQTS